MIESISGPRYTSDGGIDLDLIVDGASMPFHATPGDAIPLGRELFARATAGEFGDIAPWIAPEPDLETIKAAVVSQLQAEKCRVRDGGVTVGGVLFDTDARAQLAYVAFAVGLVADPAHREPVWKASAGVFVDMTPDLFGLVRDAVTQNERAATAWQEAMTAQAEALYSQADREGLLNFSVMMCRE